VQPGAPFAAAPPDLEVAGALLPAAADPLPFTRTDEADGVTLFTFENGMRLLVRPTTGSPMTAVSGRVLGGQWVEPEGKEGINLFTSELGMRRTRRWDREGFHRLLGSRSITASAHKSVGSRANTSRHVDYRDAGGHHFVGLGDQWATMLALLKETVFFPDFDPGEIGKLREDLVTQARLLPENNLEYIKQEFYKSAYAGHPYGRATFGEEASLASISDGELREFHAQNWIPERTVVSIVGDVNADEVAEWIASRWADLPRDAAEPWSIDPSSEARDWSPPGEQLVLDLGKNYWTVNWGRPGMTMGDDDHARSVVLARMAGNDHFYKYVYGEGVSYRSWINFWEHLGPGTWIVENDVKRERFEEILGMFDEDLARYSTTGFTEKEFADAVQRLVNRHILDAQDNALVAWRLAVAESDGVGFRTVTERLALLEKVTHADVQALAEEVFAPDEILRLVQQ
jgi:zinc protease